MSRVFSLVIAALVLMLCLTLVYAPASEATVNLFTPPLWIAAFEGVDCLIANVSASTAVASCS